MYSGTEQKKQFIEALIESSHVERKVDPVSREVSYITHRPMLVLDMDGNIAKGYNLAADAEPFPDMPENQSIPFDADMKALIAEGRIEATLFADKAMDVRLTPELVDAINAAAEAGGDRLFDIAFLTSRSMKDLDTILKASGIKNVEMVTRVADSGASMIVEGEPRELYKATDADNTFLAGIPKLNKTMEKTVRSVLERFPADDITLPEPLLAFEPKGIATNVDYRTILGAYNKREGSDLDVAIGQALKGQLEEYVENHSPRNSDGAPVFEIIEASAALETKVAAVNKGNGLHAVVKAAHEAGYTPSALVFAGDDVSKKIGNRAYPGTDYPAFDAIKDVAEEFDIPVTQTIHTQHPQSENLNDTLPVPNANKDAKGMEISPDIIVPTPVETSAVVAEIVSKSQDRVKILTSEAMTRSAQYRADATSRAVELS